MKYRILETHVAIQKGVSPMSIKTVMCKTGVRCITVALVLLMLVLAVIWMLSFSQLIGL